MGEAKNIVNNLLESEKVHNKGETINTNKGILEKVIDDLDTAIETKNSDLADNKGSQFSEYTENQYKLGVLKAAQHLIRMAKAVLEDYDRCKIWLLETKDEKKYPWDNYQVGTVVEDADCTEWVVERMDYPNGDKTKKPNNIVVRKRKNQRVTATYINFDDFVTDFDLLDDEVYDDGDEEDEI